MISDRMLCRVDARLRTCLDPTQPFGGVSIVLCGDHMQLPPTGDGSLPKAITTATPNAIQASAAVLYALFEAYHLSTQHRFRDDLAFGADVAALRRLVEKPITQEFLDSLQPLTTATFDQDPAFADPMRTRVLVTNNRSRCRINKLRAVSFARAAGRVVIGWRRGFTPAARQALSVAGASGVNASVARDFSSAGIDVLQASFDLRAALLESSEASHSFFVAGAPCMVMENVCPEKGVANGTVGTYHSLCLDEETKDDLLAQLRASPPPPAGSIVWLRSVPLHVNVSILQDPPGVASDVAALRSLRDAQARLRPYSLHPDAVEGSPVVLSLPAVCRNSDKCAITLKVGAVSKKLSIFGAAVDLFFACTIWKMQVSRSGN